jgi:hypothetical protein
MQVLVSLQGMVFCKDPYFNEPGYERNVGTSTGDAHSAQYNAKIIYNSMKCALEHPFPIFRTFLACLEPEQPTSAD